MFDKQAFIVKMTGVALFTASLVSADVGLKTVDEDISLGITGDASMRAGQAVNYLYQVKGQQEYHNQWIQQSFMHLGVDALYSKKLQIKTEIEGNLWLSLPDQAKQMTGQAYAFYNKTFSFSIYEACGTYLFGKVLGNAAPLSLSITAGLFRYKYNPEVRNLGEYLFRSLAYPAV